MLYSGAQNILTSPDNLLIKTKLGKSGIEVSKLCFGSLVMGPLQESLSAEKGAEIIMYAFDNGVNFIDTAEIYDNYSHIKLALRKYKGNTKIVIATKCYAYDATGVIKSFEKARKEMDIDVVDIFLLHEQESEYTLSGHREALEKLQELKSKGLIRATGISTHYVRAVKACIGRSDIDIIHPMINKQGLGINDGSAYDMLEAIKQAHSEGIGIYSMKALGGGNLIGKYEECLSFVLDIPFIDSVAIGMKTKHEVDANISFIKNRVVPGYLQKEIDLIPRKLHIDYWCTACGECVKRCGQNALRIETDLNGNKKAIPDPEKCVLCGYCAGVCKEFAIKIF